MDRSDCTELNFITKASNLPSILELGILSFNRAESISHHSVANEEVQMRREAVSVKNGLELHDYANLYFNARNPMMYFLSSMHAELVVIEVDSAILDVEGVILSDMNAARDLVRFGPADEILPLLKRDRLFAEYWIHDDPIDYDRHKGEMCAEVLVPNSVPVSYECAYLIWPHRDYLFRPHSASGIGGVRVN